MAFMNELQHLNIQLEEIKLATNNFSDNNVIGIGGFGKVYKGELMHSKGKSMVALKRLDRKWGQGDREFLKEIMLLSRYTHENLISLLGFSNERDEKILVYEYASRGSLDRRLSDTTLTWTQRLKICLAAAKGLSYLHDPNSTPQRVLHCDIKSSNILLDDNLNAKLSDFGLSKIGPANQQYSFIITNAVGTPGYCDPLYMKTYTLTKESDVYSFGVVLLEVLCGRLCFEYINSCLKVLVPMWKEKYKEKKLDEIIFQGLKQQMALDSLDSFSDIAYQCLKKSREKRPTMASVLEKLEIALECQKLYEKNKRPPHLESRICAGCNYEIGYGRFLSCMDALWHPECFRCHFCKQPIADYEFSVWENNPYHKSCYKERYQPKCDVCHHFIPTNVDGLIEYRAHPFWAQKYCPLHEHDGTPRCCSCERMEPRETSYAALDDGRKLCEECLDTSVMNTSNCQPLYLDIQAFYESLNMKVKQEIPLILVERQALNDAMGGERNGDNYMPETRGLCLSEESTVSKDLRTEPNKLTRRCEVTCLLILYGLPRLLTGSTIANVMMRAWLRLQGYETLSEDVEVGICNVLAHMWLTSQIDIISIRNTSSSSATSSSTQGKRSPYDKKLAEFFKHQIESDKSSGIHFRAGNQAVLKYGLPRTLRHMRLTGNFPK